MSTPTNSRCCLGGNAIAISLTKNPENAWYLCRPLFLPTDSPMPFLFRTRIQFLSAIAGVAFAAASFAQGSWPTKPIRIVVPYAPGGITDTVTRLTAPKIQEALGQPVLVENKLGNGGALATEY